MEKVLTDFISAPLAKDVVEVCYKKEQVAMKRYVFAGTMSIILAIITAVYGLAGLVIFLTGHSGLSVEWFAWCAFVLIVSFCLMFYIARSSSTCDKILKNRKPSRRNRFIDGRIAKNPDTLAYVQSVKDLGRSYLTVNEVNKLEEFLNYKRFNQNIKSVHVGMRPAQLPAEKSTTIAKKTSALRGVKTWHELKTDPVVYDLVAAGIKKYEIRLNDRNFQVGDALLLRKTEFSGFEIGCGSPLKYTGDELRCIVTHVLSGYGLNHNWAILSIVVPAPEQEHERVGDHLWCDVNSEDSIMECEDIETLRNAILNLYEDIRCLKEDLSAKSI